MVLVLLCFVGSRVYGFDFSFFMIDAFVLSAAKLVYAFVC
jgi:hypothetical protein